MATGYKVALLLVIIGALNWLLVGIFQFDIVAAIGGGQSGVFARIIYIVIGIAGLFSIPILCKKPGRDD